MEVLDNISRLLGDDLKGTVHPGARVRIAASSFSIYAFEALKQELESVEALQFIFTTPTFVAQEATDRVTKTPREFHIPQAGGERGFHGSEFEIRLKNKLTQRAVARECAEWIRRKAQFRSNRSGAPMQQFACIEATESSTVYMPLHGFTAVDLGYQQGNAVSNFVNKMDEPVATRTFLALFDQIWQDPGRLVDVTELIREHIASVYQENSPQRIYFLMLFSIFSEFLERIPAGYLMNTIELASWVRLVTEVRFEATHVDTLSFDETLGTLSYHAGGDYLNVLPSASLRFSLDKDSDLRLVYGCGLARPDPQDLSAAVSQPVLNQTPVTISLGNPNLKAEQANDYGSGANSRYSRTSAIRRCCVSRGEHGIPDRGRSLAFDPQST
jgi:hypothetical protein